MREDLGFSAIDDLDAQDAWVDEMINKVAFSVKGMETKQGSGVVYHSLVHTLRVLKGLKRRLAMNRAAERVSL